MPIMTKFIKQILIHGILIIFKHFLFRLLQGFISWFVCVHKMTITTSGRLFLCPTTPTLLTFDLSVDVMHLSFKVRTDRYSTKMKMIAVVYAPIEIAFGLQKEGQ